ncbi:patched domain-containing protein 3-like isoform X3 [Apostichopus japonicus]|uniref:patched domain-containing protein 3-like isoform X3 n=1 Tax=Stichopus japonicus TaxID=307972 RepID=UPI003AB7A397
MFSSLVRIDTMAKFDCVQSRLVRLFGYHGRFVARHPLAVLLLSLSTALVLSSGVVFLKYENNTENLFTPIASRAQSERETLEELFPTNFEMFTPTRVTATSQRSVVVIVTAKDGKNILRTDSVAEILQLRDTIFATTAKAVDGTLIRYESVCAEWKGSCVANPVLVWWDYLQAMNSSSVYLPMPFGQLPSNERIYFDGFIAPGVEENGEIVYTEAVTLLFFLRNDPIEMFDRSGLWEDAVAKQLESTTFGNIEVVYYTSDALDEAQNKLAVSVLPYFCVTFSFLTIFAVLTCLMADWVQSKPWLANSGILSALIAISSGVGLLSYCGVPFNQVVASMPFLAMGIGIDDMFIMVSAWRRTDRYATVEDRMSTALSEAAISITITSLTDFLGFCVAAITPLPAVRSFCLYTGVVILLDFVFQVTFFASMMVFSGRREAQNRHCYTCREVLPPEKSPSVIYRMFCSGGTGGQVDEGTSQSREHAVMRFFRNQFSPFVTGPFVMTVVAFCYAIYLVFGVYGCFNLTEGLQLSNLAEEGSVTNAFFRTSSEYFNELGPTVSVVIKGDVNYWEPDVQLKLGQLMTRFKDNSYLGTVKGSEFWLDDFKRFAESANVSDQDSFVSLLQDRFLQEPLFEKYSEDINFDHESGSITSSRFLIMFGSVDSTLKESDVMIQTRKLADNDSMELVVFSPQFVVYEQYVIILPNTIQTLCIAIVSMLIVSLILIPSVAVAFIVTASVISIEIGVVGGMSYLGISLDGISMINLIICIGFSIDFSAHVCYAYISQRSGLSPREKVAGALHSLGFPILQSGVSTLLSLLSLLATKSYIFTSFAKVNLLVMAFGMLHGLVFLPVVLMLLGSCCRTTSLKSTEAIRNVVVAGGTPDKAEETSI